MLASAHGFDVDCEPMEPGRVKLKATDGKRTIAVTGATVNDAATKLLEKLTHE